MNQGLAAAVVFNKPPFSSISVSRLLDYWPTKYEKLTLKLLFEMRDDVAFLKVSSRNQLPFQVWRLHNPVWNHCIVEFYFALGWYLNLF